jgi:hypothetical protein
LPRAFEAEFERKSPMSFSDVFVDPTDFDPTTFQDYVPYCEARGAKFELKSVSERTLEFVLRVGSGVKVDIRVFVPSDEVKVQHVLECSLKSESSEKEVFSVSPDEFVRSVERATSCIELLHDIADRSYVDEFESFLREVDYFMKKA